MDSMKNHSMDPHDMKGMDHEEMSGMEHMAHMGNLKQKFLVSLLLAIPIILLSPMMGMELPFQITFKGSDWLVTNSSDPVGCIATVLSKSALVAPILIATAKP